VQTKEARRIGLLLPTPQDLKARLTQSQHELDQNLGGLQPQFPDSQVHRTGQSAISQQSS
jgi:hypothetical protein